MMEVQTQTETKNGNGWEGDLTNLIANSSAQGGKETVRMECPIFLIFAEYFGYVSRFTKMAEDWCNGRVPEVHIQRFLMVEAASILRQMKKDYAIEDIRTYYERYNPLILEEYCEKLAKIIAEE